VELPRQQFISESEDLIEQVFASLDELREQPAPQQQRELIAGIFRQVHRLKGSAASFGFTGLAEIAHEFEHLLGAMRSERVFLADAVVDACDNATLALSESLTLAASGVIEPSRRELFAKLRSLTPAAAADPILEASIEKVLSQLPPELAQALTDNEKAPYWTPLRHRQFSIRHHHELRNGRLRRKVPPPQGKVNGNW